MLKLEGQMVGCVFKSQPSDFCVKIQKFNRSQSEPLSSILITFLNFFLFQLVDFEAMTAPGSEAFSKIAKSWMNLKR